MISSLMNTPELPPEIPEITGPREDQDQAAFLRTLVRRLGGDPGTSDESASQAADRLASTGSQRMMSDAFLLPLLKNAREDSAPEGIFAPGPGERRFGSMLDQAIADRILESNNFPVADALEDKLRASFHRVAGLQKSSGGIES